MQVNIRQTAVTSGAIRVPRIRRGEIYYAQLNPVIGSEQGDTRPVLIIQNDRGNLYSPTVIVTPLTGKAKKNRQPTHVLIPRSCGLNADSFALMEQIRTLDRSRFGHYIGRIGTQKQAEVNKALSISVGLEPEDATLPENNVWELCLCPRCLSDFQNSGYVLKKQSGQTYMEECDFCRFGRGWNFDVLQVAGRSA